jgi:hypothetical protein
MESLNPSRKMPRVEKIPLLKLPSDLPQMLKEKLHLGNSRSVFVIRDYILGLELNRSLEKMILKEISRERLDRYKILGQRIQGEKNIKNLFELAHTEKDIEIRRCIYQKLIDLDINIYNTFLDKLKYKYSEEYYDTAFTILGLTINRIDISNDLIEFLKENYIRNPSDFSSVIQLLGYRKNEINLRYMYTYYNFFINNFKDENYYEGPAIGIGNYYGHP